MQYAFPAILLALYPFFPESAYYLIKKGNLEGARRMLCRVHGKSDQDLINIEMNRIENNVRTSEDLKAQSALNGPAFYQCFMRTNLVILLSFWPYFQRRTFTALIPIVCQQLIGAFFVIGCIFLGF